MFCGMLSCSVFAAAQFSIQQPNTRSTNMLGKELLASWKVKNFMRGLLFDKTLAMGTARPSSYPLCEHPPRGTDQPLARDEGGMGQTGRNQSTGGQIAYAQSQGEVWLSHASLMKYLSIYV